MSRQRQVWEWFKTCPHFERLFYAFSSAEHGDVQLAPIGGIVKEDWLKKYIAGGGIKYLDYEIAQFQPAVVYEKSSENLDILESFAQIAEWVENQDVLPFSECDRVELLNSGSIAAQDETGAKYTFQVRITFSV